jgi:hypothetical protein
MSATLVQVPLSVQSQTTQNTGDASRAVEQPASTPAVRASIFEAKSPEDWNNSSSYQLAEFQRFTRSILVSRFSTYDHDVIGNVANDAFIKVGRYMDTERIGPHGLRGFAGTVVNSVAVDHFRRRAEREMSVTDLPFDQPDSGNYLEAAAVSRETDPAEFVFGSDLRDHAQQIVDGLELRLRETAKLVAAGEAPFEIERATGETRPTVRRQIARVFEIFRTQLAAFRPEARDSDIDDH